MALAIVSGTIVTGCGSSSGGGEARTPVEKAQAQVDRAQDDLDKAEAAFDSSSKTFCNDAGQVIAVVDRYGQALGRDRITVGEVQTAAGDISSTREAAGASATEAVDDHAAVADAEAALADAQVELTNATAVDAGQTTTTAATTTTTTTPLVPKETTDRVTAAEDALKSTVEAITPTTPVATAGLQVSSAAYAVEVAWLRLFADAGCLSSEEQAAAVEAVAAYTTAVQQALATAGYYDGPIDGVYGPSTVAAVEQLQRDAQLPVTGLVDPATSAALDAAVAQKAGSAVAGASARTAGIQGGLKALGYWDGPIDGKPSPALNQAIAQLQADLGLPPTGVMDPATLDAIARAVDGAKEPPTTTAPVTTIAPTTVPPATAGPTSTTTTTG